MRKLFRFSGWKHLKISQKYLVNLSMVLILMLLSFVVSAWLLIVAIQRVDEAGEVGDRVVQITEIGSLFRSKDSRVVDYMLNPGDDTIKVYTDDQMRLSQAEKNVKPYMKTSEQKKLFSQIMSHDAKIFNLFQNSFVPAVLMEQMDEARQIRAEQNEVQEETLNLVNRLRESVVKEQRQAVSRAHTQILWAIGLTAVSLVLSLALSVFITVIVQRRIRSSFDRVLTTTSRIASGDLSGTDEVIRDRDELGVINESIIRMKQRLVTMVEAIVTLSEATRESSSHLMQSVKNVTSSSENVKQVMTEVSTGIEAQAKDTSQISEMTGRFVRQLSAEVERATAINQQSDTALDATKQGKQSIGRSMENMRVINDSVGEAMDKLNRLEKRTRNLSKLIELIEGIARRTNMLALNATIESAHAGEAGKGFIVIADSIRSLSNRTSSSVKEMSEMLLNIRTETEETVNALRSSYVQIEKGNEQIASTDRQFNRVNEQMTMIGASIRDMSDQLRKVGDLGVTMRQSIESIASVSEESAAGIGDVSDSMDRVNETMSMFSKESETLAETAHQLDRMTKKFTL